MKFSYPLVCLPALRLLKAFCKCHWKVINIGMAITLIFMSIICFHCGLISLFLATSWTESVPHFKRIFPVSPAYWHWHWCVDLAVNLVSCTCPSAHSYWSRDAEEELVSHALYCTVLHCTALYCTVLHLCFISLYSYKVYSTYLHTTALLRAPTYCTTVFLLHPQFSALKIFLLTRQCEFPWL